MKIKLRDAKKEDIAFITSTWMRALWGSKSYKNIKKSIFMDEHHAMIHDRMKKMLCTIACDPENENVIFGYIVYSKPNVIHFAYTKGAFRNFGICRQLIEDSFKEESKFIVTHTTDYTRDLSGKFDLTYNPYRFYEVA
jgi:hypothetical protein